MTWRQLGLQSPRAPWVKTLRCNRLKPCSTRKVPLLFTLFYLAPISTYMCPCVIRIYFTTVTYWSNEPTWRQPKRRGQNPVEDGTVALTSLCIQSMLSSSWAHVCHERSFVLSRSYSFLYLPRKKRQPNVTEKATKCLTYTRHTERVKDEEDGLTRTKRGESM